MTDQTGAAPDESTSMHRFAAIDVGTNAMRRHVVEVEADGDVLLERWAAARKMGLFEEVFGLEIGSAGSRGDRRWVTARRK